MNDEPIYYENLDLTTVKTPVDYIQLERMLKLAEYDIKEINFLCSSFRNGFLLGYQGPSDIRQTSPNLKFSIGNKTLLWNKVMKEVKLGRYAGPFRDPPFEHFIQSPIGLVLKDGGSDTRLIFHLSYPRDRSKGILVNSQNPVDLCKVSYPDFNEVIQLCLTEGVSCNLSKSDISAAFRNLGMSRSSWFLLLMKAQSPKDGFW